MFCPKCGVKNLEDVKFCRACGTDIHLVPQALAASLPGAAESKKKDDELSRRAEPPTLENGLENIFGAVAFFLIVALGYVYFNGFLLIWIWFIIPALGHLGKGIGQVIRSRQPAPALPAPEAAPHAEPALRGIEQVALPAADTNEIGPPSVTEQTTRSLGPAAPGATRNAH